MAAAEARVAWQRTANRYFVQEDAKRAPKLACCPPPSSSESHVDEESGEATGGQEHSSAGFVPHNWNPSNYNMPTETKWWLHLQPNIGHQKDFSSEQLNVFEMELENLRNEEMKRMSNLSEDPLSSAEQDLHISSEKKARLSLDLHHKDSEHYIKNLTMTRGLTAADCGGVQKTVLLKNMGEHGHKDEELMDLDLCDHLISKKPENLVDMESSWMGGGKTEPWWRTADKDELASLVAQKSLDHVENCDLPPPQAMHVRKSPFASLESFGHDGMLSSIDRKDPSRLCYSVDRSWGCLAYASVDGKQHASGEKGMSYGSDKSFGSINNCTICNEDLADVRNNNGNEQSKAQLMEALRHSQTRAREAEQAAQQAFNEKEHIVQLFFKQASQLFAYKQWLQLLQLESLYLQLKNKDQSISTLFPVFFPWMPHKTKQGKKGKHKTKKTKRGQSGYDIGRYAVAFAVGLGLAGAGLLLGWTMGWLFPMF